MSNDGLEETSHHQFLIRPHRGASPPGHQRLLPLDYSREDRPRPIPFFLMAGLLTVACCLLMMLWDYAIGQEMSVAGRRWGLAPAGAAGVSGLNLFLNYYLGELAALGQAIIKAALGGAGVACLIQALRPWQTSACIAQAVDLGCGDLNLALARALVLHRHEQRVRLAGCPARR